MVIAIAACAQIAGVGGGSSSSSSSGTDANTDGGPVATQPPDSHPDVDLDYSVASDENIDLGKVLCGIRSASKTITITNKSTLVKTYTLQQPGDPFVVGDDHGGSLQPGETATISISAAPFLAGTVTGSLVIQTPSSFLAVNLAVTSEGAKLDWSPTAPNMGAVNKAAGGTMKVTLVNSGNVGTNLTGLVQTSGDPGFSITPTTTAIGKNASVDFTVTLASGADGAPLSATFTPTATGVCGESPTLTTTGQRVNSEVTISNGDFGKKPCNNDPGSKDLSIKNFSAVGKSWTTSGLTKFDILNNTGTGTIAAQPGGSPGASKEGIITVKPKTNLPDPGDYNDVLTVHVADDPGGANAKDFMVTLHVDVRGAKIVISTPLDMNFQANVGEKQDKDFTVGNIGNEDIGFSWAYQRTAGQTAWIKPGSVFLFKGQSMQQTVTYQPSGPPPNTATLKAAGAYYGGPRCNDPGTINLIGNLP